MTASAVLFSMPRLAHEWLKHTNDRQLDFAADTIAAGTAYALQVPRLQNPNGGYQVTTYTSGYVPTGTVMGRLTSGGKLIPCVAGATDGSQTPVGIVFNGVDATAGDVDCVLVKSRSVINPLALVWDASFTTQTQKNAALATLAAAGIVTTVVG